MKLQRANYRLNELIPLVSVVPPLRFGDRCRLISGGRDLLVVDVGPDPRFRPRLGDMMVPLGPSITPRLRADATSRDKLCDTVSVLEGQTKPWSRKLRSMRLQRSISV